MEKKIKIITFHQRQFLLTFFTNEEFAGYRNVAEKLLNTGQCIVAGKDCIWKGGIGNFIKTSNAEDAIDCLLYKFDLEYFLSSEWYKERRQNFLSMLENELKELKQKVEDINELHEKNETFFIPNRTNYYKVYNNLEDKILFEGEEKEFVHFMRKIAVENEDEALSIIHLSEAKEYLKFYCPNLELV
jgi:hypothetical protein